MSYPVKEETKTFDLRWRENGYTNARPILEQRIVIRDGVGLEARFTEEWREVETVIVK